MLILKKREKSLNLFSEKHITYVIYVAQRQCTDQFTEEAYICPPTSLDAPVASLH